MKHLWALLFLLGCQVDREEAVEEPKKPDVNLAAQYDAAVARLPAFLDRGFVISLAAETTRQHQGDSLLFSGLALYALDCTAGEPIATALQQMFFDLDGGVYRHPDLVGQEVSLDGLLGLYRGINKRLDTCGEKARWAGVMKNHRAKVAGSLPAEFNLVGDMLAYKLGYGDVPDLRRMDLLSLEVITWAEIVKARKAACYRIHLGLLALQTMNEMGVPMLDRYRQQFADATKGLQMPTIDHFAGRPGLVDWLQGFQYNIWQFEPQRCPLWESPDGYGMQHPAVDYLVGYADLYGAPHE